MFELESIFLMLLITDDAFYVIGYLLFQLCYCVLPLWLVVLALDVLAGEVVSE
jgi:hypothetical protein